MAVVGIGCIAEQIGPLCGPHMHRLVALMRDGHGFAAPVIPALFARHVLEALGESTDISLDDCPELFAAKALDALGESVDLDQARADSTAFQRRLRFHSRK